MTCPVCHFYTDDIKRHLETAHRQAMLRGEIVWVDASEAYFNGRHYAPTKRRGANPERTLVRRDQTPARS